MTDNAQEGRSLTEVIMAVTFLGFLTGFIAVLCIGNYFRAKRAMERQKQRRLARLSNGGNGFVTDATVNSRTVGIAATTSSPRSFHSSSASSKSSEEQVHLLGSNRQKPLPDLPRRRPPTLPTITNEEEIDLLNTDDDMQQMAPRIMSV